MDELNALLQKFLPRRDGGTSYELKDAEYGLPAQYLCTMTWDEREMVAELIRMRIVAELLHKTNKQLEFVEWKT